MHKYNKIFLFFVAALIVTYVIYIKFGEGTETQRKKSTHTNSEVPMHLSSFDTTAVLSLAREYLNNVVERNYDAALDMLYVLDGNNLPIGLSTEQYHRQQMAMTLYPVYGYEIKKLTFWRETDSRLDYYLLISHPTDGSDPARVRCALRPVRYADIWYLTVADDRDTKDTSELN